MKRFWALGTMLLLVGGTVPLVGRTIAAPSPGSTVAAQDGQAGAPITTTAGASELALARHLTQIGAKMYGAYWCPHCHHQLQLFGKEAVSLLPYIECDPNGQNARPAVCRAAKISAYPTWKIKGKTYLGTQSLEQLATASGYRGPRQFKNSF